MAIYLSREVYNSEMAREAISATLKAKGRNVAGLDRKIQDACNSLDAVAGQELWMLCRRIILTYNYPKWKLKALHNQRNLSEEARFARVANFKDNNPDHPALRDNKAIAPKINYWDKA